MACWSNGLVDAWWVIRREALAKNWRLPHKQQSQKSRVAVDDGLSEAIKYLLTEDGIGAED
jgi:hypothetical protein